MIDLRTFRSLLNITGLRLKRRDVTFTNLPAVTDSVNRTEVTKTALPVDSKNTNPRNAEAAERERQHRERRAKLTQTRLEAVVATGRFVS